MCEREGVNPVTANRAHVAIFVRELKPPAASSRRERGGDRLGGRAGERHDPAAAGAGPAVLRLPDGGGAARVQPGGPGPLHPRRPAVEQRGLVPRLTRLPWIPPAEQEWLAFLEAARSKRPRNRVMLALAYDAALRREELCSLRTDDVNPAHRTLRIRAGPGEEHSLCQPVAALILLVER